MAIAHSRAPIRRAPRDHCATRIGSDWGLGTWKAGSCASTPIRSVPEALGPVAEAVRARGRALSARACPDGCGLANTTAATFPVTWLPAANPTLETPQPNSPTAVGNPSRHTVGHRAWRRSLDCAPRPPRRKRGVAEVHLRTGGRTASRQTAHPPRHAVVRQPD